MFCTSSNAALVERLGHADHLGILVDHRHAQDRAGEVSGLLVEGRVEAKVGVGVGDVDRGARRENGTSDAGCVRQSDLADAIAHGDARKQLVGLGVVEEQRRAVGVQHARRLRHDLAQERAQFQFRGDVGDHVEEGHFLLAGLFHVFDELGALKCHGGLRGHRFQQFQVFLVEGAFLLVQHLDDADDLAFHGLHRRTQDRLGDEAGLFVDGAVEALIAVGIEDDLADAALEDGAGDAGGVEDANLAREIALGDARVELARLRVVEEQAAALGAEFPGGHFDQRGENLVERLHGGDAPRHREQHFRLFQPLLRLVQAVQLVVLARLRP